MADEEIKLVLEDQREQLVEQYSTVNFQHLTKEQIIEFLVNEVIRVYELGFNFGRKAENTRLYDNIVKQKEQNKPSKE